MRIAIALAATLGLVACASSSKNLQRAAAMAVGQNVAPGDVVISNVNRSAMNVEWTADTPKGRYSCSADDMVRRSSCVKQ